MRTLFFFPADAVEKHEKGGIRSDSVFVDESLSIDGEYRLNKSLPFCFFVKGGLSVSVAAELDEDEEEEEERLNLFHSECI